MKQDRWHHALAAATWIFGTAMAGDVDPRIEDSYVAALGWELIFDANEQLTRETWPAKTADLTVAELHELEQDHQHHGARW